MYWRRATWQTQKQIWSGSHAASLSIFWPRGSAPAPSNCLLQILNTLKPRLEFSRPRNPANVQEASWSPVHDRGTNLMTAKDLNSSVCLLSSPETLLVGKKWTICRWDDEASPSCVNKVQKMWHSDADSVIYLFRMLSDWSLTNILCNLQTIKVINGATPTCFWCYTSTCSHVFIISIFVQNKNHGKKTNLGYFSTECATLYLGGAACGINNNINTYSLSVRHSSSICSSLSVLPLCMSQLCQITLKDDDVI